MAHVNHIRLSELSHKINHVIENAFNATTFWVVADVTNHTFRAQKNYHNFELVEKDPHSNNIIAKISGKAWGAGANRIGHFEQVTGQKFTNNIQVLLQVKVTFHSVFGLSLEVLEIDANFTLGMLEQQRLSTLQKLVAENDFIQKIGDRFVTKNNQLPLPMVIQRIAVISSKTSAGGEDFNHTLQNNPHGYAFFVDEYHSVVQGENNADQLLQKLIEVYRSNVPYDAVVITRGGGAQTDFLIFDNYQIGRAVAKFPIPIITGIGHQKNETITDLMAHTQTKTPTKAAEFIVAHNKRFEDGIVSLQKTILIKSQQLLSWHFQALTKVSSQILSKPKITLYNRIKDIESKIDNLGTFTAMYLKNQHGNLGHFVSILKVMAPENILKKGFAIVKVNQKITSNPSDIGVGEDIEVILADTQILATVKNKTKYDGTDHDL